MKDNKDKEIVLDIEPLDENASNHEQREKRYHFYKKNGFKTTSYFIEDEEDMKNIANINKNQRYENW